jgi:hypothetical protein
MLLVVGEDVPVPPRWRQPSSSRNKTYSRNKDSEAPVRANAAVKTATPTHHLRLDPDSDALFQEAGFSDTRSLGPLSLGHAQHSLAVVTTAA